MTDDACDMEAAVAAAAELTGSTLVLLHAAAVSEGAPGERRHNSIVPQEVTDVSEETLPPADVNREVKAGVSRSGRTHTQAGHSRGNMSADDITIMEDAVSVTSEEDVAPVRTVSGMLRDQILIDDPPPRPPPPKVYSGYPSRKSLSSGAAQVVLGMVCIVCQALTIYFGDVSVNEMDGFSYLGAGVWSGIVFVAAGILCLISSRCKTKTYIKWTMSLSFLASGLFGVALFIMTCMGLSYATNADRLACEVDDIEASYHFKHCHIADPMLVCYITLLVAVTMEMVISLKMGVHCYNLVFAKKQDQLQYIRTPEGVVIVMNKGPDYTRSSNSVDTNSFYVQSETGELICPIQSEAVLHPPPYATDDEGKPASPPAYQENPPNYYQAVLGQHTQHTLYSQGPSTSNYTNYAFEIH